MPAEGRGAGLGRGRACGGAQRCVWTRELAPGGRAGEGTASQAEGTAWAEA